jgi:hypothetical protein
MSKITLATAFVALAAAAPLAIGQASAQPPASYMPAGAAPPWGATTEAVPAPPPPSTQAPQSPATPAPGTRASGNTITAAGQPPAASPGIPASGNTTPTHAVFLHAGPSGGTPVLGTLRPGESLRVLASAPGGWMQVEGPTGSGWAYGSYLAPPTAPAVPPSPDTLSR